jgi:hypothetical protein
VKLFQCQQCGQALYFENTRCERCGRTLGYLPSELLLTALEPLGDDLWRPLGRSAGSFRCCANGDYGACNWLVPADQTHPFCRACELNRTIPNLQHPERLERWRRLEIAKRQMVYSVLRFGLPLRPKSQDASGLAFDFLDAEGQPNGERPTTGHEDGVITIDAAEADPAEREQRRTSMHEPYRTLAGHFRHEVGHYYWGLFRRRGDSWLADYRNLFGDETADYGQALQNHYQNGPPPNWRDNHLSAYASSHPWEDWAETWAHYLHIVDTLETACAFSIAPRNWLIAAPGKSTELRAYPYREAELDDLLASWLPLTFAVNSLNRSMGQPDLYPFVLSPPAVDKLRFVHDTIRRNRA